MLTSIELDDFKSFSGKNRISIEKLTTIIGLNSSGKTNILEGISILANISSGIDITAYFNKYSEIVKDNIRGGAIGCCRNRKKKFGLGCTLKKSNGNRLIYYLKIDVSNEDRVYVDEENLYEYTNDGRKILLFKTIKKEQYKGDIIVEYNNRKKGKNPRVQCDRSYSIISQLDENLITAQETMNEFQKLIESHDRGDIIEVDSLKRINQQKHATIYQDINFVKENIKNVQSINPIPDKIRTYVTRDSSMLFSDASNLSAVLDRLISRHKIAERQYNRQLELKNFDKEFDTIKRRYKESKEKYEQVLSIIRLLPEYEIKDLEIIVTPAPLRDVMFTCLESHGDTTFKIPASLLSDGTLKIIAIATALVTYPKNSVLLLDEFDSATHQTKSFELLKKLNDIAYKKNIRLIVTTHNTTLLNQYDKEFLGGTSIVFRNQDTCDSDIVNFYDLYDVEKLLARGGLGDAALKDGLKKYLYPKKATDVSLPEWLEGDNL